MGTTYNVKYVSEGNIYEEELRQEIDVLLIRINQLMSTYIADSELSQFNKWNSVESFPISDETLSVLKEAIRLGEMSEGLLDVTVGPLVNLWGFGPNNRPENIPSKEQIKQAKNKVGLDMLLLGENWVGKLEPSLNVDLSTIAKGYGVDRLAELLASYSINNYLVEIGGEMRISGTKAFGHPWRVAIEKPESSGRSVQKIISIGQNAIATSGDYRNYYEEDGIRYSHLINPRTGYPVKHNLVSATVVHSSSMTADGLATAFSVMGKDKALSLANEYDIAVLLITKENGDFKEYTSGEFKRVVVVH